MSQDLWLTEHYIFFWCWSFVIYDYDASVRVTRSVTHFHSIPDKRTLCAKTCHPTDRLISLFPKADWPYLKKKKKKGARWGTSSSSKRVKSPKATRLPCPWGDYVAPSWSAIQRDWQRGSRIRGAQTPTHTPSNNRGPNVVLELIFTVHVDRFLVLSRSHHQDIFWCCCTVKSRTLR